MMMKGVGSTEKPSMWVRNVQLAGFSTLLGSLVVAATGTNGRSLFYGFDNAVWLMVLNNAAGGLCVAFVIKYADNILKGFACALATIVAAVASVYFFGFE